MNDVLGHFGSVRAIKAQTFLPVPLNKEERFTRKAALNDKQSHSIKMDNWSCKFNHRVPSPHIREAKGYPLGPDRPGTVLAAAGQRMYANYETAARKFSMNGIPM